MAETERDRLEQNAAAILAGLLVSEKFREHTASEKIGLALDYAVELRRECRESYPAAWDKEEETDVPV